MVACLHRVHLKEYMKDLREIKPKLSTLIMYKSLQLEKGQVLIKHTMTSLGYDRHIFQANTAPASNVYPWLDGHHHTWTQGLPVTGIQRRGFMHCKAYTMAKGMSKIRSIASIYDNSAGGMVDILGHDARAQGRKTCELGLADKTEKRDRLLVGCAENYGPSHVGAIA